MLETWIRAYPSRKTAPLKSDNRDSCTCPPQIIGYARVSTNEQHLATQRKALTGLGAPKDLTNGDHGVTGRNGNGRD